MNIGKYLEKNEGHQEMEDALALWKQYFPNAVRTIKIGDTTSVYDLEPMDKFVIWFCSDYGDGGRDDALTTLKDLAEHGAAAFGPIHLFGSQWQERANEEVEVFIEDHIGVQVPFLEGLAQILGDKVSSFDGLEEWVGYFAIENAAHRLYSAIGEA